MQVLDSQTVQATVDAALADFKRTHRDFDTVFPSGVNFNIGDGWTSRADLRSEVRVQLHQTYATHKRAQARQAQRDAERDQLRIECRTQQETIARMIDEGFVPPQRGEERQTPDGRRFRMWRTPDGGVDVEEL